MVRRAVHTRPICAAVRSLVERLEDRQLLSSGQLLPSYGNAGTVVFADNLAIPDLTVGQNVVCTTLGDSIFVGLNNQVTKLTPAGQPDTTFGSGGVFTLPAGTVGFISALAVQSDGKLLLTLRDDPSTDAQLMRLMPNGQPDSSWGNRGIIVFDFTPLLGQAQAGVTSLASSVLVQPDGKVLVGGREFTQGDSAYSMALARFNFDGTPDMSFGDNGNTNFLPGNYIDNIVNSMRLQNDGQIAVLSASAYDDGLGGQLVNFTLARFSVDGIIDDTFAGGTGFIEGPTDTIHNLIPVGFDIDPTGQFVVAANQYATPDPVPTPVGGYLLRYLNDGSQDTLFGVFGNNGIVTLPAGLSTKGISALVVASDNSIVVGTGDWFRIAGFTAEGLDDPNIPTDIRISAPAGQTTRIDRVVFADSGALFAVGAIVNGTNPSGPTARIALARFAGEFDNAPIINLTGPTTVAEDQPVTFTYRTRVFANSTITGYQWDYDYDGFNFVADANGADPTVLPGRWFSPQTHNVAVRIVDSAGKTSAISEISVSVTNAAPVTSITLASQHVIQRIPATINLNATNFPAGSIAYWRIDWGDGLVDVIPGHPSTAIHTYALPGTFTIQASATDDQSATSEIQTLDVTALSFPQISGFVFNDANFNGIQGNGEAGIAGVQVFLDTNNDGLLDLTETVTTTDASGYYQFPGLAVGTYHVAIVKPAELFYTDPITGRSDATVAAVSATTARNFGLADYYVVACTVFIDNNNNGARDAGENNLAGAIIFADTNNNGVLDAGEASTASGDDEVQTLTSMVHPTGGSYRLTFGSFTSGDIAWNATPAAVQAELRKATALKDIVVGGTGLDTGAMTFVFPGSGDVPMLTIDVANLTPGSNYPFAASVSGDDELQTLTPVVHTTAGTYRLTFGAFTSTAIAWNASPATVQTELRKSADLANIVVGGASLNTGSMTFLFPGAGDVAMLALDSSALTPNNLYNFAETVPGGAVSQLRIHQAGTVVRANLPTGYVLSFNQNGTTVSPALFGALGLAPINGSVFEDRDGDNLRDLSDPGVSTASVYVDINNNNVADAGDIIATTDTAGTFLLPNVPPGSWWVRAVAPAGYHFRSANDASLYVTRSLNAPIHGLKFAVYRNNSITGLVYNDANANGIRSSAEKPMANVTVFLDSNNNGQRDQDEPVAFTNSTGRYTFGNVATVEGQHIGIQVPPGYRLTTDLSDPLPAVGSGQNYTQDIGLTQRVSISGGVFSDTSRNGVWNLNEFGLRGFRVYIDSNRNGVFDSNETSVMTDIQGRFAFNNLLPGTYVFRVAPVAKWQGTAPRTGSYTVTAAAGQTIQKRNFGYYKTTSAK